MKTMRGFAMLKIGETGWVTKGIPACGPSDAICRPLALAPCTSDVHTVWAGAIGERHNMILGHEAVGEVVEVGDLVKHFKVGDRVLVRVQEISGEDVEHLSIRADIRSTFSETSVDNLKKCQVQSKYAGKVTDLRGGVVYIRLNNGVNAIAHTCYDSRMPGKKDDVSFAVTRLDEEHGIAVGIITRIIKRNL